MRLRLIISALGVILLPLSFDGCRRVAGVKNATVGKLKAGFGKVRGRGREEADSDELAATQTKVLGGTIQLVQDPYGFVLIKSSSSPPPKGAELSVHRRGESKPVAELKVSPEKKTGFVVADILSGQPRKGDVVMWNLPDMAPPPDNLLDAPEPIEPVPGTIDPETMQPIPDIPVAIDPEAELEQELQTRGLEP